MFSSVTGEWGTENDIRTFCVLCIWGGGWVEASVLPLNLPLPHTQTVIHTHTHTHTHTSFSPLIPTITSVPWNDLTFSFGSTRLHLHQWAAVCTAYTSWQEGVTSWNFAFLLSQYYSQLSPRCKVLAQGFTNIVMNITHLRMHAW